VIHLAVLSFRLLIEKVGQRRPGVLLKWINKCGTPGRRCPTFELQYRDFGKVELSIPGFAPESNPVIERALFVGERWVPLRGFLQGCLQGINASF
jgi:hypothetical protein